MAISPGGSDSFHDQFPAGSNHFFKNCFNNIFDENNSLASQNYNSKWHEN